MSSRYHSNKPKDPNQQSRSNRQPGPAGPSSPAHSVPPLKPRDQPSGPNNGPLVPHQPPNPPNTNAKLKENVANIQINHAVITGLPPGTDVVGATEHSNSSPIKLKEHWVDQHSSYRDEATHITALPENVLENLFTFLELKDVQFASLVCAEWSRVINDENGDVWRSHCLRRMTRDVLHSDLLSTCPTFRSKLRAFFHAWNPQDCSRNVYVKPNGFTIHRNPVAQSTDGARAKIGFNKGRHAWEIVWEGPLGTVAVVGVATQQADMRAPGYIALLGKDDQSWGWNLVENVLLHNGDSQGNYPLINNAPRYQVGERIRVILDCEDNTLSFEKNYEFLGVAFRGLPHKELLFPAISAVYGNTEISMVYLGPPLDG